MKTLAALLLLIAGLVAPAAASDYSDANRAVVIFPSKHGDHAYVSPFPMSRRSAWIWTADACWRDCEGRCAWRMEACTTTTGSEACRPHLDVCARACQRSCRPWGGPLLGFVDW